MSVVLMVVGAAVVAVAVVLLFCQCLLARVGVLGHCGGKALGHPCWIPPTGANMLSYN